MGKKEIPECRFDVVYKYDNGITEPQFFIFIDKKTGVNYVFCDNGNAGGLTPLLDKDGKVVITPNGKELV